MTIAEERTALKTALADTVRAYDHHPAQPTFPCAIVGFPTRYVPHGTLTSDTAEMTIPVTLYAPYGTNRSAEDLLESLIEPVIDAIEDLGAAYSCSNARDFGVLENSQQQSVALGCVIDVMVL